MNALAQSPWFWFPLIAVLGVVYFLPTIIGSIRNVEGLGWLVLFNVFFPGIGFLAGLIASHRMTMSPGMRAFVFVGILGGFTTFSSFGLDTFSLAHGGRPGAAAVNVLVQVIAGCLLVAAGYFAAARP